MRALAFRPEVPAQQRVDKALRGEQVFIVVGRKMLQLAPAAAESPATHRASRPGPGVWKGRATIPDAFYEPWTGEDLGEPEN
jgi:hypothetical protein